MMIPYLLVRENDGQIQCVAWRADPDAGPVKPHNPAPPGFVHVFDAWGFTREGRRETELPYLRDTGIEWIETASLDDLKAAAIARTYPDVDAVYDAAIGRRATEYARAEEAARAFLAAEVKPAIVSGYITGHAEKNPTGQPQSNEWSAQQIIERADAFRWAELQMRNIRFARQADMRAAATHAELATAVSQWEEFIVWLRTLLSL